MALRLTIAMHVWCSARAFVGVHCLCLPFAQACVVLKPVPTCASFCAFAQGARTTSALGGGIRAQTPVSISEWQMSTAGPGTVPGGAALLLPSVTVPSDADAAAAARLSPEHAPAGGFPAQARRVPAVERFAAGGGGAGRHRGGGGGGGGDTHRSARRTISAVSTDDTVTGPGPSGAAAAVTPPSPTPIADVVLPPVPVCAQESRCCLVAVAFRRIC